jgi:hypothetical protein
MKFAYAPPCFSGSCGFCALCDGKIDPATQKVNKEKKETIESDSMGRARLLSTFMKSTMNEESEMYRNQINLLKNKEKHDFVETHKEYIYGIIPKTMYLKERNINEYPLSEYKRLKEPHNVICDNPKCKAIYYDSPSYFQMGWFTQVPMYRRVPSMDCNLCVLCVKNSH